MELDELTDKAIDYILAELADEKHLNFWEKSFVADVTDQWQRNRFLTAAQKLKLGQIWDKM